MALTGIAFVAFYLGGLLSAFGSHAKWGLYTYLAVFYLHPPLRWWGASLPESMRWSLLAAVVRSLPAQSEDTRPCAAMEHTAMTKVVIPYVAGCGTDAVGIPRISRASS